MKDSSLRYLENIGFLVELLDTCSTLVGANPPEFSFEPDRRPPEEVMFSKHLKAFEDHLDQRGPLCDEAVLHLRMAATYGYRVAATRGRVDLCESISREVDFLFHASRGTAARAAAKNIRDFFISSKKEGTV